MSEFSKKLLETINLRNTINLANSPHLQHDFNNEVDRKTKYYQKQYGFQISDDPIHPTWNNESDAFKHAYMSAILSLRYDEFSSWAAGIKHEADNLMAGNDKAETNMDFHNNNIGYEIAREIKDDIRSGKLNPTDKAIEDKVAEKIMQRMHKGELITSPDDRRAKTLPTKTKEIFQKNVTGFAAPINNPKQDLTDKVYTFEEIKKMKPKEFLKNQQKILEEFTSGRMMHESEAKEKVKSGELIYVDSYTRQDGTKVSGYYRRR